MSSQHGRTRERDQEGRQRLLGQEAQEIRRDQEERLRSREGRKEALKVASDTNANRAGALVSALLCYLTYSPTETKGGAGRARWDEPDRNHSGHSSSGYTDFAVHLKRNFTGLKLLCRSLLLALFTQVDHGPGRATPTL